MKHEVIFIPNSTENTFNLGTDFACTFISIISNISTCFFLPFFVFTVSLPFRGKKKFSITYLKEKSTFWTQIKISLCPLIKKTIYQLRSSSR